MTNAIIENAKAEGILSTEEINLAVELGNLIKSKGVTYEQITALGQDDLNELLINALNYRQRGIEMAWRAMSEFSQKDPAGFVESIENKDCQKVLKYIKK